MENIGRLKEEINITLYLTTNFQSQLTYGIYKSFFCPYIKKYKWNNTHIIILVGTDLSPLHLLTHNSHKNCVTVVIIIPCYMWGSWGRDSHNVTWPASVGAWRQSWTVWLYRVLSHMSTLWRNYFLISCIQCFCSAYFFFNHKKPWEFIKFLKQWRIEKLQISSYLVLINT